MKTKALIEQLNKVIQVAMDNGGDAGGNYFSCPEELFTETQKLVALLNIPATVVWNDDNTYHKYPIVVAKAKMTKLYYGNSLKEYYYKNNLKILMEKYGISVKQLAEHFGCSTSQIHHYRTGRSSLVNGARLQQLKEIFPEEQDIVKALDEHINPNFRKKR